MRAAAIQMTAGGDPGANVEIADGLVRRAAALGARLVVLPEKWLAYGRPSVAREAAQPLDGAGLRWARATAAELGIDLVAGSIPERAGDGGRGFNTSVHVGPDGSDRGTYRKLHMFDVEIGGRSHRESEFERAGEEIVTSSAADDTVLGMAICYDLRFPELFRELALMGAQVVVLPSAFTARTTRDHWEVLVRARAIENQCFMVAANQTGEHAPGVVSGGRSMIVDPWGAVLAAAGTGEEVVVADLDLDRLAAVRAEIPSLASRRADVYGPSPTG